MKNNLLSIIILLGSLTFSFGQQPNPEKRPKQVKFKPKINKMDMQSVHFPGAAGVDIYVYKGEKTTMIGANYIHYILDGLAIKGALAYEQGTPFQIPYEAWYFKLIPQYSLIKIKEKLYININAGGVVTYDAYEAYEPLDSQINFGGLLGVELEYTFGRLALLANFEQQYVQTARSFAGGGLRYFFN
ncbi:MAG: hypothetical protein KTR26_05060 [Flammeovirgaceae bacterium]|nr:hypothetical protein [Flammeovirgaceae bacterium]